MTSERVEEIRAYVKAHPNRTHGPVCLADTLLLLAERDRLAAEVVAARAVADEMHVNMRRIRNERDDLRAALEKITKPADEIEKCKDPMDTDEMADAWMRASRRRRDIAREALARLSGGGK